MRRFLPLRHALESNYKAKLELLTPSFFRDLHFAEMMDPEDSKPLLQVQSGVHQPRVYAARWFYLMSYFLLTVANGGVFITFGPINVTGSRFFNVSQTSINLMSGVGTVLSVFLMIPVLWFVKKYGLRAIMIFCAAVNILGGIVRIVVPFLPVSVETYFWLQFVGQAVCMLANPALTTIPTELSSHWFPTSERSVATSIGSLATLIGLATGFSMSGFIVGNAVETHVDQLASSFKWLFGKHNTRNV